MAKEAYYFSHDANAKNDEKIIKLRMKLGWEGYGIYWAVVECLRETSEFALNLDSIDALAFSLRCEVEKLNSVIKDFGLFEINEVVFFSHSLKERMKQKEESSIRKSLSGALGGIKKHENAKKKEFENENPSTILAPLENILAPLAECSSTILAKPSKESKGKE